MTAPENEMSVTDQEAARNVAAYWSERAAGPAERLVAGYVRHLEERLENAGDAAEALGELVDEARDWSQRMRHTLGSHLLPYAHAEQVEYTDPDEWDEAYATWLERVSDELLEEPEWNL